MQAVDRYDRLWLTPARWNECARTCGGICTMKKPSKTAAELEASIKVELEDICEWPTDIAISVLTATVGR